MGKFKLSKSAYCNAIQCNKILWLDKYKPEMQEDLNLDAILKKGEEVGEEARKIFGEYHNVEYNPNLAKMLNDTEELIESGAEIITEASFVYDNNFCSIDILKNHDGSLDIYEVKSSTEVKDIYIDDLAYQYYVLKKLGYKINSANLIYLNNKYYRQGELELDKLFIIQDLTSSVEVKQEEVAKKIEIINEYMKEKEEPVKDLSPYCFEPYNCKYWSYCSKHLPENNVFKIAGMLKKEKFKHYYAGNYSFEALRYNNLKPKYLEQVIFELDNLPPKIEVDEIITFLDELYYPLYFLDFETYQQAIPLYDGINPYMQIPFQYSVHYLEKEGGELKHLAFLAPHGEDPRKILVENLVKDVPVNACVLAYNMGFEKGVLKNLAKAFPELESSLMLIHDHIKDLMFPFQKRYYYAKEMAGSYSIKKVLPIFFPNDYKLNYQNLALIHDGNEAMNAFAELTKMSNEEAEEYRAALLKYCELDTLAMVRIWEALKKICNY